MDPTRANRLIKTLAHLGMADQTADRKYIPGPGMHVLAAQSLFASGLIRDALPHLETLEMHSRVVAMGVRWKTHVSYLYHRCPGMSAAEAMGRVGLFPAHASGIGLILLAQLTDSEVIDLYTQNPVHPAPDRRVLRQQLARIRRQQFARVPAPGDSGTYSIAVALEQNAHAAIALSGHMTHAEQQQLVKALYECAESINQTRTQRKAELK